MYCTNTFHDVFNSFITSLGVSFKSSTASLNASHAQSAYHLFSS